MMRAQGLLLAPGASATRDHSSLVAIDRAVASKSLAVERINLPKTAKAAVNAVVEQARELVARAGIAPNALALGGRSFGGRMCSMAVADGLPASALVLISYPLHPPGKPDQLRVEHFPNLRVPCLFVSGTRDSFATPAELETHTRAIKGKVTHVWIEGGNHGLRGKDTEVVNAVATWLPTVR
jgi:predicted alpha/beta-hydrolase family hydrolase